MWVEVEDEEPNVPDVGVGWMGILLWLFLLFLHSLSLQHDLLTFADEAFVVGDSNNTSTTSLDVIDVLIVL